MVIVFNPASTLIRPGVSRLRGLPKRFGSDYWRFFAAASCMDLGIGLFIFLFTLYLTDLHFNERLIGQMMASLTLGNVIGTIPATILVRRCGIRPLLLITFIAVPLLCAMRVFTLWQSAQLALAFATGMALCGWPISFSPAIAKFTTETNRTMGFSLAFATGIGLGTMAGFVGGYVPELLHSSAFHISLINGMRFVLLFACGITLLGVVPLSKLSLEGHLEPTRKRVRVFHPFLLRFLPAFVLWNVVTGSFPVFGAVYLQNVLGVPLGRVGAIFAGAQLAQFAAVLAAPRLFRRLGISNGIGTAQIGTALLLVLIASTRSAPLAICFYLVYFATQFMCGPGIYQLLMDRIPAPERSTASAVQNVSGALCQAATAAITGVCIVKFGYHGVLLANAGFAVIASTLFTSLRAGHALASDVGVNATSFASSGRIELCNGPELSVNQPAK